MLKVIRLTFLLLLLGILLPGHLVVGQSQQPTHDLSLPNWGPYTKNYIGVSHIPDKETGIRFDLSVFPGYYRRKVNIPNVMYESGYHPWEASPDLNYFSYRHELEWKDQVYTDISYSKIDDDARLIRMECVNRTNDAQSIVMHLMGSIHFPSIAPYKADTPIWPDSVKLPDGAIYADALDYSHLDLVEKDAKYYLVTDGMMRGEVRMNRLIHGSGVKFGRHVGDVVTYDVEMPEDTDDATLWLRYKGNGNQSLAISINKRFQKECSLTASKEMSEVIIQLGNLKKGSYSIQLKTLKAAPFVLDGMAIGQKNIIDEVTTYPVKWKYVPKVIKGPVKNSLVLKYDNVDVYYGVLWEGNKHQIREWHYKYLSEEFLRKINSHGGYRFGNSKDGHYTNVFIRPVNLEPKSTKVINGMVCAGSKADVEQRLKAFKDFEDAGAIYNSARKALPDFKCTPAGEKYRFSQERMYANTLQNVVYPVYTQKEYIRHHAPGRWWDCLYTWDSGFIGIGLAQYDQQRGEENLNAYLNNLDEQSAFIHHGTPLPVQHYLYQELWNLYQSEEMLEENYPKLKNYYEFLSGRDGRSTTRTDQNLIKTWDYFYNSGGWDDYPPQGYVNWKKLRDKAAPVVSTAHVIRIAKILRMAAIHLNKKKDVKAYTSDIEELKDALNNLSWDPEAGYYGYVVTDDDEKSHILRYGESANYNMGLGGASPLIAGICNKEQQERLLDHLKTPGEIWSDIGLSAVDQTAPYYRNDGYWNGTVWLPHQWFFWKSMLDYGELDFAFKIASTALDLWKKEVEGTYNCFEHFVIKSGKGAGWHQFSGLSSCVTSWFTTYYKPGSLTTGYDVFISDKTVNEDQSAITAKLNIYSQENPVGVVACLNADFDYEVLWNGKPIETKVYSAGSIAFKLPAKSRKGTLEIKKIK